MKLLEIPLSERIRPDKIENFFGQKHLVDKGKPFYNLIYNKIVQSFILYGPPSSGKSTLAKIYAKSINLKTFYLNANILNKNDLNEILFTKSKISKENLNKESSLFKEEDNSNEINNKILIVIEEIHRLNSIKQDALLEPLEEGKIIIVGTTTENPFFFLNKAFKSRIFVYELFDLNQNEILDAIKYALKIDLIYKNYNISFDDNELKEIIKNISDLRKILNLIDQILKNKIKSNDKNINISNCIKINFEDFKQIIQIDNNIKNKKNYDFNDTISAFIKSMRGSDPDATIYYLNLMLENGEDPIFIARRLIIFASEDIGLAYPFALNIAVYCLEGIKNIGMPEASILLAHVSILFSLLKKSNSTYLSLNKAKQFIKEGNILDIPDYLKGGAKKLYEKYIKKIPLKKDKEEYLYPHDFEDHFVKQKYLNSNETFYFPQEIGFEKELKKWYDYLKAKYKN